VTRISAGKGLPALRVRYSFLQVMPPNIWQPQSIFFLYSFAFL
jgi:hypothetical protein